MTISVTTHPESHAIACYRVPDAARLGTLPRHFGRSMMLVETRIYELMREFCADYDGGLWAFHELSNGGFYMSPPLEFARLRVHSNGYEGKVSADAAGIIVCLFAYSLLSFQWPREGALAEHFYRLRDYALSHREASEIFSAID
ncbi:MAG: Antirestriction protein KlcA [Steroidobacteraceae bacterium]|nr:Antirestriction protein KlcA [Steroidobacteraceae bacterium]